MGSTDALLERTAPLMSPESGARSPDSGARSPKSGVWSQEAKARRPKSGVRMLEPGIGSPESESGALSHIRRPLFRVAIIGQNLKSPYHITAFYSIFWGVGPPHPRQLSRKLLIWRSGRAFPGPENIPNYKRMHRLCFTKVSVAQSGRCLVRVAIWPKF